MNAQQNMEEDVRKRIFVKMPQQKMHVQLINMVQSVFGMRESVLI